MASDDQQRLKRNCSLGDHSSTRKDDDSNSMTVENFSRDSVSPPRMRDPVIATRGMGFPNRHGLENESACPIVLCSEAAPKTLEVTMAKEVKTT